MMTVRPFLLLASAALALTTPGASSFAPPSGPLTSRTRHASHVPSAFLSRRASRSSVAFGTVLRMSEVEGDSSGSGKKRRRRRKDGRNVSPAEAEAPSEPETTPEPEPEPEPEQVAPPVPAPIEKDKVVKMEVLDVRDALSGKTASSSVVNEDDDEEEEDDDEYEWVYEDDDEEDDSAVAGGAGLESLLADAKRMRAAESGGDSDAASDSSSLEEKEDEGGLSIPDSVGELISTIVTIDFFVVCALLLWFLAGIFCSSVLRDDTVQIAFNNIFEPVVQPALGVLMIASAAGAVFKKDEEE